MVSIFLRLFLLLPLVAHGSDAPPESAASLVERSQKAMRINPEQSRALAEQALKASSAPVDADLAVRAHLLLCDYQSERNRPAAEQHIAQARALLPQVRRSGLRAGLLGCEGELHEGAGDNAEAAALYEQAVAAAEQARDDEMLADSLFKRGYLRGVRGELANGLADLKRARTLYERLQLANHMLTAENAIAILYNRMGDFAQARHYFEAALKAQKAAGLLREQAVTQHNLGRALENLKDWDGAQRAFERVLALSRELGYSLGEAHALRGLASVRNARGAPAEALLLLDRAARIDPDVPAARLHAQMLLQRGIALRLLRRHAESVVLLKQALAVFLHADSLAERAGTHGELATTLAELGDWRAAFEQQAQFKSVSDQLLRRQLDERFAVLKVEYDSAAREQEMNLLQREQTATSQALEQAQRAGRLRSIAIALGAVLLIILSTLAWRHRRASVAMRSLAMTDELTGLPNRRAVLGRLQIQLAQADSRCALLIADLDHFKSINDQHGHLSGDEVLRATGQVLRDSAREPVFAGRLGGEEFVLVLPGVTLAAAIAVAERLRTQVAALDVSHWTAGRGVTVSLGVTVVEPGDSASSMLRRADEALYEAKARGRNCVVARSLSMNAKPSTAANEAC